MSDQKLKVNYNSDVETVSGKKGAAISVVKVSKDGKHVNNFITTRNVAFQQENDGRSNLLERPIGEQYLKNLSKEKRARKKKNLNGKHTSVQRKVLPLEAHPNNSHSVLEQVLHSLVHLVKSTEVVRFITTLKATTIKDEVINSTTVKPAVLDLDGEPVSDLISDLYVAIVSNSQSGIEESAVLVLRKEPLEDVESSASDIVRLRTEPGQEIHRVVAEPIARLQDEDAGSKKDSLQLHPDNPPEVIRYASRLLRGRTAKTLKQRKRNNSSTSKAKRSKSVRSISRKPRSVPKLQVLGIFPIYNDTKVRLNGGGQVKILAPNGNVQLDTVSVRSMWGFVMALQRARHLAKVNTALQVEKKKQSHAWVTMYVDDNTSVANLSARNSIADLSALEVHEESNNNENDIEDILDGKNNETETDTPVVRNVDAIENENPLPRKRDLMHSIKKILMKYDIEDVTPIDIYEGLETEYGKWIIGEKGFSKALIDKFTVQAVGQVDPPTKILDHLFLGTEYNAGNRAEMEQLGIKHVVNVTEEVENFFPSHFSYLQISLKDVPSSDLGAHFREAINFIQAAIEKDEGVLVHCQRGVSRSASVVLAFLMAKHEKSFDDALQFTVDLRPIVKPNEGFKGQLRDFEAQLEAEREI